MDVIIQSMFFFSDTLYKILQRISKKRKKKKKKGISVEDIVQSEHGEFRTFNCARRYTSKTNH